MAQSISEAQPNGSCRKCGFPMIKENGIRTCVNCKTYSEPSGLVNDAADPGHNAMAGSPGVKPGELKPVGAEADRAQTQPKIPIALPQVPRDAVLPEVADGNGIEACMGYVRKYFSNIPVKNMLHAKKLFKLQKEIDSLSTKITTFLGE